MATQYANGKIVTSGLVLALDAADRNSYPGSGITWTDVSGNGNSGILTNGPAFSNNSIVFDGSNDFVTSSLNFPSSNPFTINSWVYYATGAGQFPMIVSNNGGDVKLLLGIKIGANQAPGFNFYMSGIGETNVQTAPQVNNWYNVVATYSSTNSYIYVNGDLKGSFGAGTFGGFTNGLWIGNGTNGGNSFWKGNISNIQIYNRALSVTEILQNYNAQKSRFNL